MKYEENPLSKANRYTKLKEGQTRLRFFDYVQGWEYWVVKDGSRSPVRVKQFMDVPNEWKPDAKFFVAYVVWNYETKATQVCSLTQKTIISQLSTYLHDPDWGDEKGLEDFDIVIEREGTTLQDTEYHVTPKPKTPFKEKLATVHLEALFEGEDPFGEFIPKEDLDNIVGN